MFVYSFQLQLQKTTRTAQQIIQEIDPNAPIPQALEGGNAKGPLYDCILDVSKEKEINKYWKSGGEAVIYTFLKRIEILEKFYRPDYYVNWQFNRDPIISAEPF